MTITNVSSNYVAYQTAKTDATATEAQKITLKQGTENIDPTGLQKLIKPEPKKAKPVILDFTMSNAKKETKEISLVMGQTARILLTENPSTGYRWQYVSNGSFPIQNKGWKAENSDPRLVGGAGVRTLEITPDIFSKSKKEWVFNFNYARSWESNSPLRTIKLVVNIDSPKKLGTVVVKEDNNPPKHAVKEITLKVGQKARIKLIENPSTGYRWEVPSSRSFPIYNKGWKPINSDPGLIGGPGITTYELTPDVFATSQKKWEFNFRYTGRNQELVRDLKLIVNVEK